jgi:uncharacterized protein (DUF1778 family)
MPPKPKRGRPPLPKGTSKGAKLVCRLLESELEEIGRAANAQGMTTSEFVRGVVLAAARAGKPKG